MIAAVLVYPNGAFAEIDQAIVRGGFLIAAGAMLAFSSAVRERRREQLAALTDWPGPDPSQINSPNLATLLAHCARVLEAPRVLVVWEESEEPFVNIAAWDDGRYTHTRDVAGAFGEFVQPQRFVNTAFWTDDATTKFAVTSDGPIRLQGPVIDPGLVKAFHIATCATAPFEGTFCKGRVFILDRWNWTEFQTQLAQIIAARVANALDRQIMQGDAREAAAERERSRLTRDLHDGLLQSLTAAGLQIRLLADNEQGDARTRLEVVKQLLNSEQRRIRDFVRKAPPPQATQEDVAVNSSLGEVLAETARHWNCTASLVVEPEHARIPATLCVHVSLMLAEAVANAVRHGAASRVEVTVKQTADQGLEVGVRDNGRGFYGQSFSYANMDVLPAGMGPYSLRERVRELGGSLGLSSSSAGVELQIRLQSA
jgi:signal transduction histidine kinase